MTALSAPFGRSTCAADARSRVLESLRQGLVGAGLAYAAGVFGYAAVRRVAGCRPGWQELIDDLEPWAYLPAPALAALGAATGSRSLTAASVGLMSLFGLRWGSRYLRHTPSTPSARSVASLTVMTYNTLAWQREGHDLEQSILTASPDIVALQEIGPRAAHYLAAELRARFPYHYISEAADPSGAAVLSRYPIREMSAFKASEKGHWWQKMSIDTPAGPIAFFNIHTKIPYIRTTHRRKWLPRIPLQFHAERRL